MHTAEKYSLCSDRSFQEKFAQVSPTQFPSLPYLGRDYSGNVPSALLAASNNKRFFTSCLALRSPMGGPTVLSHTRRLVEASYGLGYFCQVTKMYFSYFFLKKLVYQKNLFTLIFKIYFYLCLYVVMYICVWCCEATGVLASSSGVIRCCVPYGCWELNSSSPQEQKVLSNFLAP